MILIFPNILLLVYDWALYDGVRLFLYLIPFICIIPAILFFFLYKAIKGNLYKFNRPKRTKIQFRKFRNFRFISEE